MFPPKFIEYCSTKKTIVVLGYTKTGKIGIARELEDKLQRPLFISDNYILKDMNSSLDWFYRDIMSLYGRVPIIIEGVMCFRLLRNNFREFTPDLIIKTECNEETIRFCYAKDGEGHKLERALIFNKGLNTVWNEYLNQLSGFSPEIVQINTSLR